MEEEGVEVWRFSQGIPYKSRLLFYNSDWFS
jgi:hypothetical protein